MTWFDPIYQKESHWLDDDANSALRYACKRNATFAATIKEIKNPLSRWDVYEYYKEDPYKGAVATSLYLLKHKKSPREFSLLASSSPDIIRCQIRYWTKLLEKDGIRPAFYASAGYLFESKKPHDVETSAIFTLPPWELLHFIGIEFFANERPPILSTQRHYFMLDRTHSEKKNEWYSKNDEGEPVPNKTKMDDIYFDYCVRESTSPLVFSELKITRKNSYFFSYPIDFKIVARRIGFHNDQDIPKDTRRLMSLVIDALYTNDLLMTKPNVADYIRLDAFIMANPNIDTSDITIEGGGGFSIIRKGASPEEPIILSCPRELVKEVEERIMLYLIESFVYLPKYERWDIVNIESKTINGKVFDVCTVHVSFYDIFGTMTSQHLVEWFFKNKFTT